MEKLKLEEKLKERIETKVGRIVMDILQDIEFMEEREAQIIKELEKLKKKKNRKGRIILLIKSLVVYVIMHY